MKVTAAAAARLAARFGLSEAAAAVVAREGLVPPVHAYLDRSLRLDALLRGRPGAFRVPAPRVSPLPDSALEVWGAFCTSFDFNQALLRRIAASWGLEGGAPVDDLMPRPPARTAVNHNFDGTLGQKLRRKTLGLMKAALKKAAPGRPLPTVSMAYHTDAFKDRGFYLRRFEDVKGRLRVERPARDPILRREAVAAPLETLAADAAELLLALGFSRRDSARQTALDMAAFAADVFPPAFLEGLSGNVAAAKKVLAPFGRRPLFGTEGNGEEASLLICASRDEGREVIILQHGGYSGYIEDHVGAVELEYPYADRFVSWGWTTPPDEAPCRDMPVVPMPCPWLSERHSYWNGALPLERRDPRGKPVDLLLMTNRVYRFAQSPSGSSVLRSDRLGEYTRELSRLVEECARRGVTVLHKPYSDAVRAQMRDGIARLQAAHPRVYTLLDTPDKGMTPALLAGCGAVLWDGPGTGFLECLTSGLPAFSWWPRVYNEEEPRWRELFAALEDVGLVGRTPEAVLDAYAAFKKDPAGWTADPRRTKVRGEFLRLFAWTEPDWARRWKDFVDALAAPTRQ